MEAVDNQLAIDASAAQRARDAGVSDEELSKRIAEAIVRKFFNGRAQVEGEFQVAQYEVEGSNFEFDVDVDDREVVLEGTVPRAATIPEIVRFVHGFPGVTRVDNELRQNFADSGYGGWLANPLF